jgi:hypothetical protein
MVEVFRCSAWATASSPTIGATTAALDPENRALVPQTAGPPSPLCGRHRRGSQAARLRLHQTARNFEITALVFARKDGEEWVSRRSKIQEQVVLYVEFGDLDSFDVLWKVP